MNQTSSFVTLKFLRHNPNLRGNQQARIEAPQEFEVEVVAETEGAWIRIPEFIVESDPRWQILAANGVLRAKWDGVALRLFAATERSLMMEQAILSASASGLDCCARCQYYEQNASCCRCVDSPLEGRVVDPSGYCLEYIGVEPRPEVSRGTAGLQKVVQNGEEVGSDTAII